MPLIPPGTRKGNRCYILRETINGRLFEVSTEATNERAARRFARDFRKQTEAMTKRATSTGLMTFSDAADRYLAAKGIVAGNTRNFVDKLKRELGNIPVADVFPDDVLTAAHTIYPGRTNETKNRNAVTPAAAVLHFAAQNEWRPWIRIDRLREKEPETRRVSARDMKLLMAAAKGDVRRLLVFIYYQGWRLSEALSLTQYHIDFEAETLRVYVGKARRWKNVPLDLRAAAVLRDGPWHGSTHRAFPWETRWQVYRALRPLCKHCGVTFTPHMARHAFASELDEAGATTSDMLKLGTWTNEHSILRYQSPSQEHLRALMQKRNAPPDGDTSDDTSDGETNRAGGAA